MPHKMERPIYINFNCCANYSFDCKKKKVNRYIFLNSHSGHKMKLFQKILMKFLYFFSLFMKILIPTDSAS